MKISEIDFYLCHYPPPEPFYSRIPEARDFMLTKPFAIDKEGYIQVPEGPGLGVELDLERIKAHGEKL